MCWQLCGRHSGGLVLDLGCGSGLSAAVFASKGEHVLGMDLSLVQSGIAVLTCYNSLIVR